VQVIGARAAMERLVLAALLGLAPIAAGAVDLSRAQATLPEQNLVVITHDGKGHLFHVEMATTADQQEIGLMWRKSLAADHGMMFVWPMPQVSTMWMKNTLIPLDMLFVASDGTVAAIDEDAVPHSLAIISSGVPVLATIELQGGITEALDIRVGDKVDQQLFGTGK